MVRKGRVAWGGLALVALLQACVEPPRGGQGGPGGGGPDHPREAGGSGAGSTAVDAMAVRRFEARGYPPLHQFALEARDEWRTIGDTPVRLQWLLPVADGREARFPLVVYLPGLAQDGRAHERWRRTVAEAGYAVLSWQPLAEDERPPDAAASRPGDTGGRASFAWAQQRFGAEMLSRRAARLGDLMATLTQARREGDARLRGVDLDRAALAGYELGAFTAQWAAGEQVRGVARLPPAGVFRAFIALSPVANVAQGGFETRYRAMPAPVLSITADADLDPWGIATAASLHSVPFAGMPEGGKYLMRLQGADHAALGGREPTPRAAGLPGDAASAGRRRSDSGAEAPGGGRGGRGEGERDGDGRGGRRGGPPGTERGAAEGRVPGRDDGASRNRPVTPTERAIQASALGLVSIAFLDAHLQDDPAARAWLADRAGPWLAPVADWRRK